MRNYTKNMIKRIGSLLLCAFMLAGSLPTAALAAENLILSATPATNLVYNNFSQTLVRNPVVMDGTTNVTDQFEVTYIVNNGEPKIEARAADAGSYTVVVTADAKEDGNYAGKNLIATYIVDIAPIPLKNLKVQDLNGRDRLEYTGQEQELLESTMPDDDNKFGQMFVVLMNNYQLRHNVTKEINVYFEMNGTTYPFEPFMKFPKATEKGRYVIDMYADAVSPNYSGSRVRITSFVVYIGPKYASDLTADMSTSASCTYNGETQPLLKNAAIIKDGSNDVTSSFDVTYTLKKGNTVLVNAADDYTEIAAKDAGDYTIEVTYTAKAGIEKYTGSGSSTVNVSIARRAIQIAPDSGQSKVYGTEDPVFGYWVTRGNLYGDDKLSGALSREPGEDAGLYAYTIGTLANDNYDITFNQHYSQFRIKKATPELGTVTGEIGSDKVSASEITLNRTDTLVAGILSVVNSALRLQLGENDVEYTFTPDNIRNYEKVTGTVKVVVTDTLGPIGEVTMAGNTWRDFQDSVTFDQLLNENASVTAVAEDAISGVAKVEYLESKEALSLEEVKAASNWKDMNADENGKVEVLVSAEDEKTVVYYIRLTDNVGNITYLSTDGVTFDTKAPVVNGITDGMTCYTTQKFTIEDLHPGTATVNGTEVTDYILAGNVDAEYEVIVTDAAGNSTAVKVNMKPISVLTDSIKDLTVENVVPADEENINAVENTLAEMNLTNVTAEEKAVITEAQKTIDALQEEIEAIHKRTEDVQQETKDAIGAAEGIKGEALPDNAEVVEKLVSVKQAYENLSEKEKALIDETLVQNLTDLYEDAVNFQIIKGMDGVFTKGTSEGLEFTANGSYDLFTGILVDGKAVDPAVYTAKAGSTIVTLNADYLKTLDNGEHSLEVLYEVLGEEYSADCAFTVKAAPVKGVADTGDYTNMIIWPSMMLISAIVGVLLVRRKNDRS